MLHLISKRYLLLGGITLFSLSIMSCSLILKKEKAPMKYGRIEGQIISCIVEYREKISASLILERLIDSLWLRELPDYIDTAFDTIRINCDLLGKFAADSILPGLYIATADGSPIGESGEAIIKNGMRVIPAEMLPSCETMRIGPIRIAPDSTSFLTVKLRQDPEFRDWPYDMLYPLPIFEWEEKIYPNPK